VTAEPVGVPERRSRDGLFAPGSPIRRLAGPATMIPAAGRMVLLQLAHPQVAQAVADST
jgi:uncharacterized protein (DUF2236 family)